MQNKINKLYKWVLKNVFYDYKALLNRKDYLKPNMAVV